MQLHLEPCPEQPSLLLCYGEPTEQLSLALCSLYMPDIALMLQILALPPDMAKGGKGPLLVCDDLDLGLIWKRLNNVKDLNDTMRETIRCTVTGAVERGLLVNLFGVRGFVPVSHVTRQEGQDWLAKEDLQVCMHESPMSSAP